MILNKVKGLPSAFSTYGDKQKKLGFDPIPDIKIIKQSISNGRWSLLVIETNKKYLSYHGIKITPKLASDEWPVYKVTPYNNAFIYTPDIISFILFRHYSQIRDYIENSEKYRDDWDKYLDAILPYYKYWGGKDKLNELHNLIVDEANWPDESIDEMSLEDFIHFMVTHDKSKKFKQLVDIVKKLQADDDYLPKLPTIDTGIWSSRIINMIGMRAYSMDADESDKRIEPLIFQSFIQPHGYDAEGISPKVTPNDGISSANEMNDLANSELTLKGYNHDKKVIASPEYKAALAIKKKGKGGYTGLEHIEAAAILDSEMNEPIRAWNCLLSAGYWAGMNKPELQETIMEAAIYLCKKHKWTEAADAVQYNLDIYKS